jgi:hypothetical protein
MNLKSSDPSTRVRFRAQFVYIGFKVLIILWTPSTKACQHIFRKNWWKPPSAGNRSVIRMQNRMCRQFIICSYPPPPHIQLCLQCRKCIGMNTLLAVQPRKWALKETGFESRLASVIGP